MGCSFQIIVSDINLVLKKKTIYLLPFKILVQTITNNFFILKREKNTWLIDQLLLFFIVSQNHIFIFSCYLQSINFECSSHENYFHHLAGIISFNKNVLTLTVVIFLSSVEGFIVFLTLPQTGECHAFSFSHLWCQNVIK